MGQIIGRAKSRAAKDRQNAGKYLWTYRCEWSDPDNADFAISGIYTVITGSDTNYQQASAAARRLSLQSRPNCIERIIAGGTELRMKCRRVGSIEKIP